MSKDLRNTLIAVALFVVLAGVMIYLVTDTQTELDAVEAANTQLEEDIKANNKIIAEGPELRKRLEELNNNFRDYVKILPSAEVATEEKLLRVVQAYCEAAQVRLKDVVQNVTKKGGGGKGGEFEEVAVLFTIEGDFDSFVRYLNLLERHEQFLKVNTFNVAPGMTRASEGKVSLDLNVTIEVTTYKYIPKK